MSKPTAIFLLAGVSRRAKERGQAITDEDLSLLEELSERGGVDAEIFFSCEDPVTHGKKPTMAQVRAERPRLLEQIAASGAKFVVALGPVPVAALWNRGGLKVSDLRSKSHDLPDVAKPAVVTFSLEEMAVKSGLVTWAGLDIMRGIAGTTPVKMGDYEINWEMSGEIAGWLEQSGIQSAPLSEEQRVAPRADERMAEKASRKAEGIQKKVGTKQPAKDGGQTTTTAAEVSTRSNDNHGRGLPMLWSDGSGVVDVRSCLQRRCSGAREGQQQLFGITQDTQWHSRFITLPTSMRELSSGQDAQGAMPVCSVDLETFPGINPWDPRARIRMAVISHRPGFAHVIPAGPASELPEWFAAILRDERILKVGSNPRFDVTWLRRFGYETNNYMDTAHVEHLLDENAQLHDLKSLALKYTEMGDYAAEHRKLIEERGGWEFVTDAEQADYCGGDGEAGISIWLRQQEQVAAQDLSRPYRAMAAYYPAIGELQMAGACVSMAQVDALDERYVAEIARLKAEIRGALGAINPNSPDQLATALQQYVPSIDLRRVFWKRKAEDDPYSTEAMVLRREATKHPVIGLILQYRRRTALRNFVRGIRKYVVRVGGQDFVFSSLRGDITTTYRHSSSHPNLQNLPRRTDEEADLGLNVKSAYVSRFEGGHIAEFDQSQLELRETAMVSGDHALTEAFMAGEDVHTTLAAMMHGIEPAAVTEQIRQAGKVTNFHVLYGGGSWGLSMRLGCSQRAAEAMIEQFDDTFTGFRRWEAEQHQFARERLWVENRYGFRRRFQKPYSYNSPEWRHAKRQAGNAPIQGGASIHVNLGIVRVLEEFRARGLRSVPFLTVHDSIVVDVFPGEEYAVAEAVRLGMEHPRTEKYGVALTIPLAVDGKMGPSWGDMQKFE